jgi:16S rRNA pseudouridine516 synthase
MRLDRFLGHHTPLGRKGIKLALAAGQVSVNGFIVKEGLQPVSDFDRVSWRGEDLIEPLVACYLMLNKPAGCASATKDARHPTVIDLLPAEIVMKQGAVVREDLHLAGRLDFNTTGLIILTNDGQWSRRLTEPKIKIPKTYLVELEDPIHPDTEAVFEQGIYFSYENITTSAAQLQRLSERCCRLSIYEGRYHQVKRMFGYFDNKVVTLHRESMGAIRLDDTLAAGEYRLLNASELDI